MSNSICGLIGMHLALTLWTSIQKIDVGIQKLRAEYAMTR